MSKISQAVETARAKWHMTHGKCSMCDVGDKPSGGHHRGTHRCGNAEACIICVGALPPGEICRVCGRKNVSSFDS